MSGEHEKPTVGSGQDRRERYRYVPCVVVVSGLPATGKTTFGRFLEKSSNFRFLDVDVIREEIDEVRRANPLARWLPPDQELEIVTRSYTIMCQRAKEFVTGRTPTIIAGTFSRDQFKEPLQDLKDYLDQKGIPLRIFHFTAPTEEIESRITGQKGQRGAANVNSIDTLRWVQSFFSAIKFTEVTEINTETPGHYVKTLSFLNDLRSPL